MSDALSRDYGDCSAFVAEPRHLVVSCINPPFAARPRGEGIATARKVAAYAWDHHPKSKGVEDVTVAFLDRKEADSFIQPRHARARYVFTAAELGAARP